MLIWHALGQVKGDAEAVTDALKQLSALLRTHSQRKPQQVTSSDTILLQSRGFMPVISHASPCHPAYSMHGTQLTSHHHHHEAYPSVHKQCIMLYLNGLMLMLAVDGCDDLEFLVDECMPNCQKAYPEFSLECIVMQPRPLISVHTQLVKTSLH